MEQAGMPCCFPALHNPSSSPAEKIQSECTEAGINFLPHAWAISRCSAPRWSKRRITCASGTTTTPRSSAATRMPKLPNTISSWRRWPTCYAASCWCRSIAIAPTSCSPRWRWRRSSATKCGRSIMRLRLTRSRTIWRPREWPSPLSPIGGDSNRRAWDAIPWNAVISMRKGVRVAIKSDSDDFARRLNQEAAKTIRYGGATEEEALKMITLNAAWIIGVDDRVGSIEVGKDADLVIWDGYPLSTTGVPEKVLIDGEVYFDRAQPGLGMTHYKEGE